MTWKRPGQHQQNRMPEPAMALKEGLREEAGDELALGHPDMAPLEISHAEMNDAVRAGAVVPFGQGLSWVIRYLAAWWVEYEGGWLRVTDVDVTAELDEVAERLREASATVGAEEPGTRRGSDAIGGGPS